MAGLLAKPAHSPVVDAQLPQELSVEHVRKGAMPQVVTQPCQLHL